MTGMTAGSFDMQGGKYRGKTLQIFYQVAELAGSELDHIDITQFAIDLLKGDIDLAKLFK